MKDISIDERSKSSGFSLMEILVAIVIFVIIMLMMSSVYHQSTVAWDSGMRKAEGAMDVRAILGFMQREMSQAVAFEGALSSAEWEGGTFVTFVTLAGDPSENNRQARKLHYQFHQGEQRVERIAYDLPASSDYSSQGAYSGSTQHPADIATNIAGITFTPDPDYSGFSTELPRWVKIRIAVDRTHDVSAVGARSAGPDMTWDTDDDIRGW